MRFRRLASLSLFTAALLAPTIIAGCSDDEPTAPTPGSALIGSWDATSFATAADDFIAQGMTLVMTLKNDGTYALAFTNDLVGACNPGPDCIATGPYTATATTMTIDPGTADEAVFTYSIAGSTLTMNSSIGGTPVTIVLTKI